MGPPTAVPAAEFSATDRVALAPSSKDGARLLGALEARRTGAGGVPTVMLDAPPIVVISPLNFSKTPEKTYGPSATSEPTMTLYVNESTATRLNVMTPVTASPSSMAALGVVLAAEFST